jgi:hypothetical protein
MSILSTLALLGTALVARRPEPDRVEELELELEGLKAQLDSVRKDALRWQALAESWRARYEGLTAPAMRAQAAAMQQYAQIQAAAAQAAQAFHQGNPFQQQNQQLGMQAFQDPGHTHGFDGFCNCVPSRAQVWGANRF